MTQQDECLQAVELLNAEAYKKTPKLVEEHGNPWSYETNGFYDAIKFMGFPIWDSESDERPYTDTGEEEIQQPLDEYLRAEVLNLVQMLRDLVKHDERPSITV